MLPPISELFDGEEETTSMVPSSDRVMRSTRAIRKRSEPYVRPQKAPTVLRSSSIDTVPSAAASGHYSDWFVGGLLPIHHSPPSNTLAGEEKENQANESRPSSIDSVVSTMASGQYSDWFMTGMLPMSDSPSPPQSTVVGEVDDNERPQQYAMEEEQREEFTYFDAQPTLARTSTPSAAASRAASVSSPASSDMDSQLFKKKPYSRNDRTKPRKVNKECIRPQEDYGVFDPHQVLPERNDLGTYAHGKYKQFWIFLLDHLVDPSMVDTVAWTGRAREFTIRSPEMIARLWWQYRKNAAAPSVESTRRVIRALYKKYILIPVNAPQHRYAFIIEPSFYVGWTREQLDDYIYQHCVPMGLPMPVQPLLFNPIPDVGSDDGDDSPNAPWSHHANPQPLAQYTVLQVPGHCYSAPPTNAFSYDSSAPYHTDPSSIAPSFSVPATTTGASFHYHNVAVVAPPIMAPPTQTDGYWYPPPGTVMQQSYYQYQPSYHQLL